MRRRVDAFLAVAALLGVFVGCTKPQEPPAPASSPEVNSDEHSDVPPEIPPADPVAVEDITYLIDGLANSRMRDVSFAVLLDAAVPEHLDQLQASLARFKDSPTRWRVVRVIAGLASPESSDLLSTLLQSDPSLYVRRNAAWGLGQIGDASAAPVLQAALDDEDDSVRLHAATALNRILREKADPILRDAAKRHADGGLPVAVNWLLDRKNKGTRTAPLKPGVVGRGVFEDTQYLVYVPSTYDVSIQSTLLVSVHGTNGLPEPYVEMCIDDAERFGVVVLAPFFDYPTFPNYDLLELNGTRSDTRLFEIIKVLGSELNIDAARFLLYGHSKGGQFVSRMVLAHPDRILAAVGSGAGHHVLPDPLAVFPGGTRLNPSAPDLQFDFAKFVGTRTAFVVGSKELPRRVDEFEKFKKATLDFAANAQIPCQVQFEVLGGIGHSGRDSYVRVAGFLYDGMALR